MNNSIIAVWDNRGQWYVYITHTIEYEHYVQYATSHQVLLAKRFTLVEAARIAKRLNEQFQQRQDRMRAEVQ